MTEASDIDPVLRRVLADAGLPDEDAEMMRHSRAYAWARLYAAVAELGRTMVPRRWRRDHR